eukprot:GEMP01004145.1.p1 GENE.GEMP01004145.1~~GEMP01004145.1.p1  ORF type:complete len:1213 (+),score=251.81 GEMP01004145.1:87-3725(+)
MARKQMAKLWSFVLAGAVLQYMEVDATADFDAARDAHNNNRGSNDVSEISKGQVWRSVAVDPSGQVSLSEQDTFAAVLEPTVLPTALCRTMLHHNTKIQSAPCQTARKVGLRCCSPSECTSYCDGATERSHPEANTFCQEKRLTLCTETQLASDKKDGGCGSTGCNFDLEEVWMRSNNAVVQDIEPVQFVACDANMQCFALFDRSRELHTACCANDTCTYSDCTTGSTVQRSEELCPTSICSAETLVGKTCNGNKDRCGGNLKAAWTSTPVCKRQQDKSANNGPLCGCISEGSHQSDVPVTLCHPGLLCNNDGQCVCPTGKLMQVRTTAAGRVVQHCTLPGALSGALCCDKKGDGAAFAPTDDFYGGGMSFPEAYDECKKNDRRLCSEDVVQATLGSATSLQPVGAWVDIEKCVLGTFTPNHGSCICESINGGGVCGKGYYCTAEGGCIVPCAKGGISTSTCACSDGSPPEICQIGEACQNVRCQVVGLSYQKITGFCMDDEIAVTPEENTMRQLGDDGGTDMTALDCIKKCNGQKTCAGFTIGGGKAAYPYFVRCRLLTAPIDALQLLGPFQCMHTDTYIVRAPPLKTVTSPVPAVPKPPTPLPQETAALADLTPHQEEGTLSSSQTQLNSRLSAPVDTPNPVQSGPLARESTRAQQDTPHFASLAQQNPAAPNFHVNVASPPQAAKNSGEFLHAEKVNAKKPSFLQLNVMVSDAPLKTSPQAADKSRGPAGDSTKTQEDKVQMTSVIQQNPTELNALLDASHPQVVDNLDESAKAKKDDMKKPSFLNHKSTKSGASSDKMQQPSSLVQHNSAGSNIPLDASHPQVTDNLGESAKAKEDDVKKSSFLNHKSTKLGASSDVPPRGADKQDAPAHKLTETKKDEMKQASSLGQQNPAGPNIPLDASDLQVADNSGESVSGKKGDMKKPSFLNQKSTKLGAGSDVPPDGADKPGASARKPTETQKAEMKQASSLGQKNPVGPNIPLDPSHPQVADSLGESAKAQKDDLKKSSFLDHKSTNLGAGPDVPPRGADKQGAPPHKPTETQKDKMQQASSLVQLNLADPNIPRDASHPQDADSLGESAKGTKDDVKKSSFLDDKSINLGVSPDITPRDADKHGAPTHKPPETQKDKMKQASSLVELNPEDPNIPIDASLGQVPEKSEESVEVHNDDAETPNSVESGVPFDAPPHAADESGAPTGNPMKAQDDVQMQHQP